jgi:hypothetical protein
MSTPAPFRHLLLPAVGSSDCDDVTVMAEGAMHYLLVPVEPRRKSVAAAARLRRKKVESDCSFDGIVPGRRPGPTSFAQALACLR